VPKADNLNQVLVVIDAINNSVGAVDQFAEIIAGEFRNLAPEFRELGEKFGS
jgi:hypothetical protein